MNRPVWIGVAAFALLSAAFALALIPSPGKGQDKGNAGSSGSAGRGGFVGEKNGAADLVHKPAPAFKLEALDGKPVALADLKGKVVVLDFWATWCVPCRAAMPHLQEISTKKELADKGLKVVAVDAEEDKGDVQEFIQKAGYTFTVLLDKDGTMIKDFGVSGFPTTIVVGRDGTVKAVLSGYTKDSAKELDEAVAAALKDEAPAKK